MLAHSCVRRCHDNTLTKTRTINGHSNWKSIICDKPMTNRDLTTILMTSTFAARWNGHHLEADATAMWCSQEISHRFITTLISGHHWCDPPRRWPLLTSRITITCRCFECWAEWWLTSVGDTDIVPPVPYFPRHRQSRWLQCKWKTDNLHSPHLALEDRHISHICNTLPHHCLDVYHVLLFSVIWPLLH